MVALYIVSSQAGAGKTTICAGLGRYFLDNGKKVGYLKPAGADGDTSFMKQVLGLSAEADTSQGRDVVLVEGMLGTRADDTVSRAAYGAAKETGAKVLVVEAYSGKASGLIDVYKGFAASLLGIVINKVPQSQLKRVQGEVTSQFGAAGINVLGVLPEDRVLAAITVAELAESVKGKVLNSVDKSGELVESFMLGAMVVDSGLSYFGRKSNKAAIVRQDRPDMQMAALETSTRCLLLVGSNQPPVYSVLQKAENRGIPVISTESKMDNVVANIEDALSQSTFNQAKKLPKLAEMMKQNLNLKAMI